MENSKGWIDISVPLYTGMAHWPDNPPVRIERMMDLARGDAANVSKIELGAHTGTHMDAPRHFLADGAGIDEMPFDATIGPARVIRIEHPQAILPEELEASQSASRGARVVSHAEFRALLEHRSVCRGFRVHQRGGGAISWPIGRCARSGWITSRSAGMCTMASRRIEFCSARASG